ncbi:MAG: type II toxin-antitoxin system mRNA interferase toxin, RelE/StbE family [Acidobacteria bacterium]|nr:type II toxin-antitoxin system mRNA interferase toxin, RelE/StbE family [Acidobacteriota bacterium]
MKRLIQAIYVTSHVERRYKKLLAALQALAEEKERLFRADAFDPRLSTHKLKGKLRGLWAFSVTPDIRIVFEFLDGDEVLFHDIGPHGTVY